MTSARIPEFVIAHATCVFSHTFKKEHWDSRIKDESCSSVSLGALSDITVVLGVRQSIDGIEALEIRI